MSVKDSISHLIAVQVLDERVVVLTRRLESLPIELGEREARNETMRAEADGMEAQRMQTMTRANSLENDVRDLQARIEKLERQQLSLRDAGAVAIAAHEAEECRSRMGHGEEEALTALDKAEELEPKIAEARKEVEEDAVEIEMFRETVARDQEDLKIEIEQLKERRAQRIPRINRSLFDLYERLLPSRKGKPMAPLRGEACGGCGMAVPANDRVKVKAASTIATCRSCQRILVEQEIWAAVREATQT